MTRDAVFKKAEKLIGRVVRAHALPRSEFYSAKRGRPSVSPFSMDSRRIHCVKVLSNLFVEHWGLTGSEAGALIGIHGSQVQRHSASVAKSIGKGNVLLATEIDRWLDETEELFR